MNKPLKGVGYDLNSTNKGFSFAVHDPAYVEPGDSLMMGLNLPPLPSPDLPYWPIPQFQCFATPGTDEYVGKTILKIVAGGVNYTNSNLPNIKEGVEQNFAQAFITKAAVLSSGVSAVAGAVPITSLAPFMLNNGFYVIDNPSTKHYVVLSYYDGNGPGNVFDIPILTQRTPWVSIVSEGSSEFTKLFIEQGPSYYTGLLNIAPMIDYRNAEDEIFGFGHTSYFKPVKFGANVKILATIENNLTTQTAHGSQNLTIPLQNHGTRLMYVPGMREFDDPYYSQTDGNFGYVVNKSDITALSSLSYTGSWWTQITNNSTPQSVTVNNYSYYSVSTGLTDNMREFTCSVIGVDLGEYFEHRLRIKMGLVTFKTVTVDDEFGIITTNPEVKNLRITEPNIYITGSTEDGLGENDDYLLNDGYLKLEEGSDYYVFLFKVIPDWSGASESKAPQLVISKVADAPNTDIVTKANGGGYTTAYLMVEEPTPVSNIVTADPETGYVGSFDPAVFNDPDHVIFHAEFLQINRDDTPKDRSAYSSEMRGWLDGFATGDGSGVPVFAKPSTNPDEIIPDGMTIDHVPYDVVGFIGYIYGPSAPYVDYANGDGSTNFTSNNIIKGWDVGTLYGYTTNPIVSGIIDTNDFEINLIDQGGEPQPIVEFTGEDIQISGTTTSLSFLAKTNIQDKLIGYTKTSCYRKDIAHIKWEGENSRFIVKQLHNGPVVIEDNPIHLGTTIIAADEDKGWIDGTAPTDEIVGVSFGGYTKSLNDGTTNQPDGSTTEGDYLPNQPSQIENPEIT